MEVPDCTTLDGVQVQNVNFHIEPFRIGNLFQGEFDKADLLMAQDFWADLEVQYTANSSLKQAAPPSCHVSTPSIKTMTPTRVLMFLPSTKVVTFESTLHSSWTLPKDGLVWVTHHWMCRFSLWITSRLPHGSILSSIAPRENRTFKISAAAPGPRPWKLPCRVSTVPT